MTDAEKEEEGALAVIKAAEFLEATLQELERLPKDQYGELIGISRAAFRQTILVLRFLAKHGDAQNVRSDTENRQRNTEKHH